MKLRWRPRPRYKRGVIVNLALATFLAIGVAFGSFVVLVMAAASLIYNDWLISGPGIAWNVLLVLLPVLFGTMSGRSAFRTLQILDSYA